MGFARPIEKTDPTIKSARRVLEILEYLKLARTPVGTTDISIAIDAPISSTAALLKSLTALGYLVFDRYTRTYRASVRVGLLGFSNDEDAPDTVGIRDVMDWLAKGSGGSAFLAVRNDIHVQYIRIAPGEFCALVPVVGHKEYLTRTPAGMLLLSLERDEVIERTVRRINSELGPAEPPLNAKQIVERIKTIRTCGHARSCGDIPGDTASVAMLLPKSGYQAMAMGILAASCSSDDDLHQLFALLHDAIGSLDDRTELSDRCIAQDAQGDRREMSASWPGELLRHIGS